MTVASHGFNLLCQSAATALQWGTILFGAAALISSLTPLIKTFLSLYMGGGGGGGADGSSSASGSDGGSFGSKSPSPSNSPPTSPSPSPTLSNFDGEELSCTNVEGNLAKET